MSLHACPLRLERKTDFREGSVSVRLAELPLGLPSEKQVLIWRSAERLLQMKRRDKTTVSGHKWKQMQEDNQNK